jgi:hypothetical protein
VEARHDRGFSGTAAGGAQARLQLETVAPLMPAGAAAKSVTAGRISKGGEHSDQLKGIGQIFFFLVKLTVFSFIQFNFSYMSSALNHRTGDEGPSSPVDAANIWEQWLIYSTPKKRQRSCFFIASKKTGR